MAVLRKYNDVAGDIGAGYLKKIYKDCLCIELEGRGISFERQLIKDGIHRFVPKKLRNFVTSRKESEI